MRLRYLICSAIASAAMLFNACTPDDDSLGGIGVTADDIAAGIGFSIDVDQKSNQVTFTSLMPSSYTTYWEYGPMPADGEEAAVSGSSTGSTYNVGIAFPNTYYVRMAVQTRGGLVFSDRASFTIDKMNTDLLSDEAWTLLTGGVGKAKTWVLDIDADGTSLKFGGPKWFYTAGANWNNFHDSKGANYVDSKTWDASTAIEPSSDWYWSADWAGNQWICGAQDYGTMTFDLENGANVDVNGAKGTFTMDADAHTISFTGTLPLAIDQSAVSKQCPSGTYKIIYLTENAMQILFDGGNETPFSYNYISKDYKDNYVAPTVTSILLPEKWESYVFPANQFQTSYKFDKSAPYAYFDLAGKEIEKGGPTTFPGSENIGDALIAFDMSNGNKVTITDVDGNNTELRFAYSSGTLTTDADSNIVYKDAGLITFDGELPSFEISTNADARFCSADNQLQILAYEASDLSGDITDLWIGSKQYDAQGNALYYMAYHLIKQVAGGATESFTASLNWAAQVYSFLPAATAFITGEGEYTMTVTNDGSVNTKDPHLMYLDIAKLLKKHPKADIVIKSVTVDGTELIGSDLTDDMIPRGVGDVKTTGRRYLLNPWGDKETGYIYEALLPKFGFSDNITVTFNVVYDCGDVVLK